MNCTCPIAGYCPNFGKVQSNRHWQICRGEVLTPEACDAYRTNWMSMAYANGYDPLSCSHRGSIIDERIQKTESKTCGDCAKRGTSIPVYACSAHGRCTLKPWQAGQVEAVCSTCESRKQLKPPVNKRHRIEPDQLLPSEFQFNNSLVRFRGKLLMAYRVHWDDSRVALAELDENFQVTQNSWLSFKLGMAQEDPRLFVYRDELYCSFSAVYSKPNKFWTDVCYGKVEQGVDGYWYVGDEYSPQYAGRNLWEKNWGFFEYQEELYCVYSIKPHKILKIQEDRAEVVAETQCEFPGKPGLLHGGAPPIFHRGEFYSFYHRRLGASRDKFYTIDLYTFEAKPPFRPSRHIELDLLRPDVKDRPASHVPHAIFPGGAFINERHEWVISYGYYDKWCEIATFGINDVERSLVSLPSGPMKEVAYVKGTNDLAMWKEVHSWNEYDIPEQLSAEDVIIDIGAHIGAFTRLCLDRGAGYVIAVEPCADSFKLLELNTTYYAQRIDLLQLAIGGNVPDGERVILRNHDSPSLSRVAISSTFGTGEIIGEADVKPLSYILPQGNVRLLKLDCEGAEYDIIRDAGPLSNVQQIVGEAHKIDWQGGIADITTLTQMLQAIGFQVTSQQTTPKTWLFTATR